MVLCDGYSVVKAEQTRSATDDPNRVLTPAATGVLPALAADVTAFLGGGVKFLVTRLRAFVIR